MKYEKPSISYVGVEPNYIPAVVAVARVATATNRVTNPIPLVTQGARHLLMGAR